MFQFISKAECLRGILTRRTKFPYSKCMTTEKNVIALSDGKTESQPPLSPCHCSASNEFADTLSLILSTWWMRRRSVYVAQGEEERDCSSWLWSCEITLNT